MPEQVTVIITETAPGGGSRFYQEPGRPSSVDVDSLTPNTEYRADAEYESPDGTTIQASNSMTFRTLPIGMFSISNPSWKNDNDGQHSTFTFDYTSTYALSYAQVVDMATGVTYQGTIVGSSVTAQLPAGTAGTQHNFQLIIADIYGYSYVQGYVMTLQASMAETPFYVEKVGTSGFSISFIIDEIFSGGRVTLQKSYDNNTWKDYIVTSSVNNITLSSSNPKVYFRAKTNLSYFSNSSRTIYLKTNGNVNVGGNIASLKSPDLSDNTSYSSDFGHLFSGPSTELIPARIVNASSLYLGNYDTLAAGCYQSMFNGCNRLISAPKLPATTLAVHCYANMFQGCTALTQAPALPATTLANYCYSYMFRDCTSLTATPVLPAKILTDYCYQRMFANCSNIDTIICLATNISATSCTRNWTVKIITYDGQEYESGSGVAANGTFYKSPNMSSWSTGVSGIPSGWTVVDYRN